MPDDDYWRPPLSRETEQLVKERKKDGETFDLYIRKLMGVE